MISLDKGGGQGKGDQQPRPPVVGLPQRL